MTEHSPVVRVLFNAPHVRACSRPDQPSPNPTNPNPTRQLLEVINARLNYAEHDFPKQTTNSTKRANSDYSSTSQ